MSVGVRGCACVSGLYMSVCVSVWVWVCWGVCGWGMVYHDVFVFVSVCKGVRVVVPWCVEYQGALECVCVSVWVCVSGCKGVRVVVPWCVE